MLAIKDIKDSTFFQGVESSMAATCCGQHENHQVKDSNDFSCISFLYKAYLSKQPLCPSANFPQAFLARTLFYAHADLWEEQRQMWLNQMKHVLVAYVYSQTYCQIVERQVENKGEKRAEVDKWLKCTCGYRQRQQFPSVEVKNGPPYTDESLEARQQCQLEAHAFSFHDPR